MPKGRIQIRLSEDVAAILNEHGRAEKDESDPRPTRTQIIEEAVRLWDALSKEQRDRIHLAHVSDIYTVNVELAVSATHKRD